MLRHVTQNLSIGSVDDARRHGESFDHVVSLAAPPDTSTDQFLIDDGEHSYETFSDAVDTVVDALENDEDVLVHCNAGMSRSVSVSIAAHVTVNGAAYSDAYDACRHGFQHPDSNLVESAKRYIRENTDRTVQ